MNNRHIGIVLSLQRVLNISKQEICLGNGRMHFSHIQLKQTSFL